MIKLLSDKIGIVPITDADRTPSGRLIIPDMAKERSDQGIVKYVGKDVKEVKIGDYLLFGGWNGTTVQFSEDSDGVLVIMREKAINAILGAPDTEVRGLFFKGQDNEYFPATYEMAMNLIAESFRSSDFAKNTGFKSVFESRGKDFELEVEEEKIRPMHGDTKGDVAKLLGDRVLIKLDEAKKQIGGLYLSEAHLKKAQTGIVVASGPGIIVNDIPCPNETKPGDKVVFANAGRKEVKINGEEYHLFNESELLAVVNAVCTKERHIFPENNDDDCQCGLVNKCRVPR